MSEHRVRMAGLGLKRFPSRFGIDRNPHHFRWRRLIQLSYAANPAHQQRRRDEPRFVMHWWLRARKQAPWNAPKPWLRLIDRRLNSGFRRAALDRRRR